MAAPRRRPVLLLLAAITHALQPPRPKHYARTTLRRHVTVPVPLEYAAELAATALALVAPGKGVSSPSTSRRRRSRSASNARASSWRTTATRRSIENSS